MQFNIVDDPKFVLTEECPPVPISKANQTSQEAYECPQFLDHTVYKWKEVRADVANS